MGKFLVIYGGGQVWGKYGRSENMWGRNGEVCWGVGEVSGMWGNMGKVWKSV